MAIIVVTSRECLPRLCLVHVVWSRADSPAHADTALCVTCVPPRVTSLPADHGADRPAALELITETMKIRNILVDSDLFGHVSLCYAGVNIVQKLRK